MTLFLVEAPQEDLDKVTLIDVQLNLQSLVKNLEGLRLVDVLDLGHANRLQKQGVRVKLTLRIMHLPIELRVLFAVVEGEHVVVSVLVQVVKDEADVHLVLLEIVHLLRHFCLLFLAQVASVHYQIIV